MKDYKAIIAQETAFLFNQLDRQGKVEVEDAAYHYMGSSEAYEFIKLMSSYRTDKTYKILWKQPKLAAISLVAVLSSWYTQLTYYNPERLEVSDVRGWFSDAHPQDIMCLKDGTGEELAKYMYELLYDCLCTFSRERTDKCDIIYYLRRAECPELFSREEQLHIVNKLKPFLKGIYLEDYDTYEENLFIHLYALKFMQENFCAEDSLPKLQTYFMCYYGTQRAHTKDGVNNLKLKVSIVK